MLLSMLREQINITDIQESWDFCPRRFSLPFKTLMLASTTIVPIALASGWAAGLYSDIFIGMTAITSAASWFAARQYRIAKNLNNFECPPIHPKIQAIAESLFLKAKLEDVPDVRLTQEFKHNASIYAGMEGKTIIMAGTAYDPDSGVCTPEETASILAHETGHKKGYLITKFFDKASKIARAEGWGIFASGMLCTPLLFIEPRALPAFALAAIAKMTQAAITNRAFQYEENRADRNSMWLYPSLHARLSRNKKAGYPERDNTNLTDIIDMGFSTHPPYIKRHKSIRKFYDEAVAFYKGAGIDIENEISSVTPKTAVPQPL